MDRGGNGMIAMGECNRDGAPGTGPLGSGNDLPPRTSPPSKLDPGPFEVHSTG